MNGESDEADPHFPDEATPDEVPDGPLFQEFGLQDRIWSEDQWLGLLRTLIGAGIVNWKDITSLVLGHLNPSQVGTSLASSAGFKRKYGKGNTMQIVVQWVYNKPGGVPTADRG